MLIYEGTLLPEQFRGQMIHSDAGPNVVRSYPVQKDGAGYKASIVNIMEGVRDQWFRPSDVCVAPDGSLMVSDWYDPGVGGHQAGDLNRGRVFRIAPPNTPYTQSKVDLNSVKGAIAALQNPNLSVRYQAYQKLKGMGAKAEKGLVKLYKSNDPRMKARALWMLTKISDKGQKYVEMALKDANPDIRITGLRAARQLNTNVTPYLQQLAGDPDPQVRREVAITLRYNNSPEAPAIWTQLAKGYDGKDRWYLEALGIGADKQWDRFFAAWLKDAGSNPLSNAASRDIVWRARTGASVPLLASLASDSKEPIESRLRYFRAFDFNPDKVAKSAALVKMMEGKGSEQTQINKLALTHLDPSQIRSSPVAMNALKDVLNSVEGTQEFVEMVGRYEIKEENPRLLKLAQAQSSSGTGRNAANTLLKQGGSQMVINTIAGKDEKAAFEVISSLRGVGSKESLSILQEAAFNTKYPLSVRREAARAMGGSSGGEDQTLALLRENKFPEELKASAASGLMNAWRRTVRQEASNYLGAAAGTGKKIPAMSELMALKGNPQNGLTVFQSNCSVCHQVNGQGADFGPKLSEIGSKLPKEAQYVSILHPDAGISFGYEGYEIKMKDGSVNMGIIASQTENDIDLKMPGGSALKLKRKDVASMKKMDNSMMPTGLHENMTNQQLADLVEYLMTLKKTS
jgi:putative heme-binding domain-containing protein